MTSLTQFYKREYRAWNLVKNACLDKTHRKYYLYGAKGIEICQEWHKFSDFIKDMGGMPEEADGIILADKSKGINKFNVTWGKVKRGTPPSLNKKTGRTKKVVIKDAMSFCLTLNVDHYAYIKRQAILRSQQIGDQVTTNDLIREALIKAYPYSSQFDMFGGRK